MELGHGGGLLVIALLDTSEALDVCAMELGCAVKQLVTPLTGFLRQKEHDEFAIDNGAFAGFRQDKFLGILAREREVKHLCRFVVVPDVVADARRTLEVFDHWKYSLTGWPLAFAAQDGIENLPIPWKHITAVFIGGTTEFKVGDKAKAVIRAAQAMGKYVHVGRVNTPGRFEYFDSLGVDSIDGTGLSRYTHMRERIWKAYNQPNLLDEGLTVATERRRSTPLGNQVDESVPSPAIRLIEGRDPSEPVSGDGL
jgi:hypothetical protein